MKKLVSLLPLALAACTPPIPDAKETEALSQLHPAVAVTIIICGTIIAVVFLIIMFRD